MANREMKKSGIDWIGEIPKNWNVVRLGRIGKFSASGIDKKINKNEEVVKIVNYVDVYRNNKMIIDDDIDFMEVTTTAKRKEQNLLEKGDMVFTPSSETIEEIGRSAVVYETIDNLSFSYHVLRFHPNVQLDLSFKKYMANNHFLYNHFSSRAVGTVRKTLNRNDFNAAPVIIPPLEEQQKIAAFLDEKVAHIDNIIEDTKKSIENLKAYKQSLITETVTKGLNPDVEMKDSGIEWVGKIPKHWQLTKVKYFYDICLGKQLQTTQKRTEETLEYYLRAANVNWNGIDTTDVKKMWFNEKEKEKYKLKNGDLIVSEGGDAGRAAIFKGELSECYVQNAVHRVRGENTHLLYYWIFAAKSSGYIDMICNKATFMHFTVDKFKELPYVNIPKKEQEDIVCYIDEKSKTIDSTIEQKEQLITELEAYKKSLIYEYVTGKKEVK